MAHIRIADEVVEAAISVEGASTKFAGSSIQAFLIFPDLIRHILIFALGAAERIRFGIEILFQSRTVSINSGRNVTVDITRGRDGVFGYLFGNLENDYFNDLRSERKFTSSKRTCSSAVSSFRLL